METRELRYFVAVAEELHFGRAAQRLGIAQPPLSRAIAQLERRLGVALLERTSRSVGLTEAGEVLLREGGAALDAGDAADRRTRRAALAATGDPGLVIVTKAGASSELLAKLLDAYAAEPGAVAVDVVLCGPAEQERLLPVITWFGRKNRVAGPSGQSRAVSGSVRPSKLTPPPATLTGSALESPMKS